MYFTRKKGLIKIRDFWFCADRERGNESGADFAQYHDMDCVPTDLQDMVKSRDSQTLVTDLTEEIDALYGKIGKYTRQKIRRAKRENTQTAFYYGTEAAKQEALIRRFDEEHAHMFALKGIDSKSEQPIIAAAGQAGMLALSVASIHEGQECAWHVYIVGNGIARSLHGVSNFREATSNEEKNAIGRANRLLYWDDIQNLKNLGFKVFDWGGYSSANQVKGIAEWKDEFGGIPQNVHNYIFATSTIAKLGNFSMKLFQRNG